MRHRQRVQSGVGYSDTARDPHERAVLDARVLNQRNERDLQRLEAVGRILGAPNATKNHRCLFCLRKEDSKLVHEYDQLKNFIRLRDARQEYLSDS